MTDWSYYEAARRFQRVLVAAGIDAALKARGVMVRGRGRFCACGTTVHSSPGRFRSMQPHHGGSVLNAEPAGSRQAQLWQRERYQVPAAEPPYVPASFTTRCLSPPPRMATPL